MNIGFTNPQAENLYKLLVACDKVDQLYAWNSWVCSNLPKEQALSIVKGSNKVSGDTLLQWENYKPAVEKEYASLKGSLEGFPRPSDKVTFEGLNSDERLVFSKKVFPNGLLIKNSEINAELYFSHCIVKGDFQVLNSKISSFVAHRLSVGGEMKFEEATIQNVCSFENVDALNTNLHKVVFNGSFRGHLYRPGTASSEVLRCRFKGPVDLGGNSDLRMLNFSNCRFEDSVEFRECQFGVYGFDTSDFMRGTTFSGCSMGGRTRIVNCNFEGTTRFFAVTYELDYPDFEGTSFNGKGSFSRNDFTRDFDTHSKDLPHDRKGTIPSLKTFAKIRLEMAAQGNLEDAHFYFRKEMQLRSSVGNRAEKLPYKLYGIFADYGNAIWRPFNYLCATAFLPVIAYMIGFAVNNPFGSECLVAKDAVALSLSNTLKFLGLERLYFDYETLRKLPTWYKVLGFFQSLFGIVFLFLIGVGLRTRLRLN